MTPKKLSRRDAIKLLGAATGATLLANLPSKWSKPELSSGVLPAHAQTSISPVSFSSAIETPITCGGLANIPYNVAQPQILIAFEVLIAPQINLYPVNYQLVPQNVSVNVPLTGQVLTNSSGLAALSVQVSILDTPNQLENTFSAPLALNSCVQIATFSEIQ